jgi:hypothetical protein
LFWIFCIVFNATLLPGKVVRENTAMNRLADLELIVQFVLKTNIIDTLPVVGVFTHNDSIHILRVAFNCAILKPLNDKYHEPHDYENPQCTKMKRGILFVPHGLAYVHYFAIDWIQPETCIKILRV